MGRNFLTELDNGSFGIYSSVVNLDIEGNPLSVVDARGNTVTTTLFDIAGNAMTQTTMDAGQRWMLNDVTGKPIKSWDGANREFSFEYDVLHRPTQSFIKDGATVWKNMVTEYGESAGSPVANNLRGKAYRVYDGSGFKEISNYDFKGNALTTLQKLLNDGTIVDVDWASSPALSSETFTTTSLYDALNRPIEVIDPLTNERTFFYGDSGALIQMDIKEAGLSTKTYINNIAQNAKGQRESISYGNGTKTKYEYDPFTYRVKRIQTNDNASSTFQDLNYWYDAVGNIVMIKDDAQQTLYYNGSVVDPILKYTYDPIYRLIESEGRELIGNVLVSPPTAITDSQFNGNYNDAPWMGDFLTGAGGNVQNYTQEYSYDEVNNMTQLKHSASSQTYTRNLVYNTNSNQLQSTTVGSSTMNYTYDAMGNMVNLPHLNGMIWNNSNQLACVQKSTENIFYQYDASGNRTRKFKTDVNGNVEERIYLGECEIFRTFVSSSLTLERTTMHVSDGSGRIAMLEVRTVGSDAAPAVLRRYIYSNHLQTASLELDENKNIISYEEYHAFGTTAYQLTNASINAVAKRYKYSGKEKDEESGLYYHGARYYIPWLCRWSQCDPIGIKDGLNIYAFCSNNPVMLHDPSGMAADEHKNARKPQNFNSDSLANESSFVKGDTLTDSKGNVRNYLEDKHRFESPDEASKHKKNTQQGGESKRGAEFENGNKAEHIEVKPSENTSPSSSAGNAKNEYSTSPINHSENSHSEVQSDNTRTEKSYSTQPIVSNLNLKKNPTAKNQNSSYGWLSYVPIIGPSRDAYRDFKKGYYGWAAINTALAVTDVFMVKSLLTIPAKVFAKQGLSGLNRLFGTGKNFSSHTWGAAKSRWRKLGIDDLIGGSKDHWLISQDFMKKFPKLKPIGNQFWNIIKYADHSSHMNIGHSGILKNILYKTPIWSQLGIGSIFGKTLEKINR